MKAILLSVSTLSVVNAFTVHPLARHCPTPPSLVRMPFPVGPKPERGRWRSDFSTPNYSEDAPGAEAAVKSLILALQEASAGPYKTYYTEDDSARDALARAIEAADAAGADPEKLRVAREVAASQALPGKADRFW